MDRAREMAKTRPSTTLIGESLSQSGSLTDEARLLLEIIQWKRWRLQRAGIEPKRVYMNFKTKQGLERGIFHKGCVTVVPRGTARVATVCGLDIHEVADLPDGFVDVSGDEEY